jgi:hypothetical protein
MMVDDPQNSLVLQNRLLFLRNLKSAIDHMQLKNPDDPIISRLRCPKFMDFKMPEEGSSGDSANVLEHVK